jgi:ribonuclease P protein component
MRKSLTREERLKKKSDFDRVFNTGKRWSCSGARLIYTQNGLDFTRFAVCPVRKYGTAVERNRAKRICRELFRTMKKSICKGFDIVLVVYPGKGTFKERKRQFLELLSKANLSVDE